MCSEEMFLIPGEEIEICIRCPQCGTKFSETFTVPWPNLGDGLDTHSETLEQDYETMVCPNCNERIDVLLQSSCSGSEFYILSEGVEQDSVSIEYPENPYDNAYDNAVLGNQYYFETFRTSMQEVWDMLLKMNETIHKHILLKMLEIQIVVCLETYLSDALINNIANNNEYLSKFIRTFHDYANKRIKYSDLVDMYGKRKKVVLSDLTKLTYHNLVKIGFIYKNVFSLDYDFEDKNLLRIISKRHDLVHRNGKDNKGKKIVLTNEEVRKDYSDVYEYIKNLDTKLRVKLNLRRRQK